MLKTNPQRVSAQSVRNNNTQLLLLPIVLIALLTAACSSESTAAQVATPAQEAEAVSTTTTTTTTTIAATTTIVASTTTAASEAGSHDHGPDGHNHGSGAGFVEYNATKTDTHQHSATENVVKHEHAYVIGPDSHWHEGEKIIYESNANVFSEDDLTNFGDGTGLVGQFFCEPGGCQRLSEDEVPLEPYLGGTTIGITDGHGHLLYDCPVAPVFETEQEYYEFESKLLEDPESYGCIPVE